MKDLSAQRYWVVAPTQFPGTAHSTFRGCRVPVAPDSLIPPPVAQFPQGMPRFRLGPSPCDYVRDIVQRTAAPTPRNKGWFSPEPPHPVAPQCIQQATAAANLPSIARQPGGFALRPSDFAAQDELEKCLWRRRVHQRHRSSHLMHSIPFSFACYVSQSHRKYGLPGGFLTDIISRQDADGMLCLRHNNCSNQKIRVSL